MSGRSETIYSLEGRTAFIVGVTGQIGTAVAQSFRQHGADVAGIAIDEEGIGRTRDLCANLPGSDLGLWQCDITRDPEIEHAVGRLKERLDGRPLDFLLLVSGGVGAVVAPGMHYEAMDREKERRTFDLNYDGPVYAGRLCLPLMHDSPSPVYGAICSMSYVGHLSRVQPYRAAKSAFEDHLSFLAGHLPVVPPPGRRQANKEWRVLGYRPGFVKSEQNGSVLDLERVAGILNQMPRDEFQTPEEVADAIVATYTPAFRGCNGAILDIAAGYPHMGLGRSAH